VHKRSWSTRTSYELEPSYDEPSAVSSLTTRYPCPSAPWKEQQSLPFLTERCPCHTLTLNTTRYYLGGCASGLVLFSPRASFMDKLRETDGLSDELLSPTPRPACIILSSWSLMTSLRREEVLCRCNGRRFEDWVGIERLGKTIAAWCSSIVITWLGMSFEYGGCEILTINVPLRQMILSPEKGKTDNNHDHSVDDCGNCVRCPDIWLTRNTRHVRGYRVN
jgi:hypothetical protein